MIYNPTISCIVPLAANLSIANPLPTSANIEPSRFPQLRAIYEGRQGPWKGGDLARFRAEIPEALKDYPVPAGLQLLTIDNENPNGMMPYDDSRACHDFMEAWITGVRDFYGLKVFGYDAFHRQGEKATRAWRPALWDGYSVCLYPSGWPVPAQAGLGADTQDPVKHWQGWCLHNLLLAQDTRKPVRGECAVRLFQDHKDGTLRKPLPEWFFGLQVETAKQFGGAIVYDEPTTQEEADQTNKWLALAAAA